jgi:hypothetical protein
LQNRYLTLKHLKEQEKNTPEGWDGDGIRRVDARGYTSCRAHWGCVSGNFYSFFFFGGGGTGF